MRKSIDIFLKISLAILILLIGTLLLLYTWGIINIPMLEAPAFRYSITFFVILSFAAYMIFFKPIKEIPLIVFAILLERVARLWHESYINISMRIAAFIILTVSVYRLIKHGRFFK
jgi:hypothetical protein